MWDKSKLSGFFNSRKLKAAYNDAVQEGDATMIHTASRPGPTFSL
jgi:hypothetical protein